MSKPTIFISHISEEAEIATMFREEIETHFLGMVDIFVSSDAKSLRLGKNWLSEITIGLRNCAAMLVFCSPYSIGRPWINFECGAGWARAIDIAPICHSGLRPVDLPLPISLLQGIEAADPHRIGAVFQLIADKLDSRPPKVDGEAIAQKVRAFEKRYTEATEIMSHLESIRSISVELISALANAPPNLTQTIEGVPERLIQVVSAHFDALQHSQHLQWNYGVNGIGFAAPGSSGGGNFGILTFAISQRLRESVVSIMRPA